MSEHQAIISDLESEHRRAVDAVNRWRGHCIECFARIEQACAKALDALSAQMPGSRASDHAMFGARIKALEGLLQSPGLGKHAKASRNTLSALESPLQLRNAIVHSVGQVWIDNRSNWVWTYRYVSNAKGRPVTDGKICSEEAVALEKTLASKARSLSDTLGNLVSHLESKAVTE